MAKKKNGMTIHITKEQEQKRMKKIDNIQEHIQNITQGTGVQRNKKKYTRKQKHTKGWD